MRSQASLSGQKSVAKASDSKSKKAKSKAKSSAAALVESTKKRKSPSSQYEDSEPDARRETPPHAGVSPSSQLKEVSESDRKREPSEAIKSASQRVETSLPDSKQEAPYVVDPFPLPIFDLNARFYPYLPAVEEYPEIPVLPLHSPVPFVSTADQKEEPNIGTPLATYGLFSPGYSRDETPFTPSSFLASGDEKESIREVTSSSELEMSPVPDPGSLLCSEPDEDPVSFLPSLLALGAPIVTLQEGQPILEICLGGLGLFYRPPVPDIVTPRTNQPANAVANTPVRHNN